MPSEDLGDDGMVGWRVIRIGRMDWGSERKCSPLYLFINFGS